MANLALKQPAVVKENRKRSRKIKKASEPPKNPLNGYEVKDQDRVASVLHQQPNLAPQLIEMREAIRQYFPGDERILLDTMWDEPTTLIAEVVTNSPHALSQLEKFATEWEDPRWKELDGRLHLTIAHP